ncbi:MAG: hypothetical protein AVDCRST_MAG86-691 [uncultured Truepera sp.]|uniref:DinB-like domain-containing protein n=1 Tax=uncultured Truepera sp. TaxID=543023 RepID=A0A6J4UYN6_9DEIN|nr:MAG: hypothetical protein AVDCRST_MAG86-691 [uncultured Truepera sp.]
MTGDVNDYQSRGARALVLLHEQHLRGCLEVWKQAKAANIKLPETDDENYQSLETLLKHILRSAGNYMVSICKNLELPDPEIKPVPGVAIIEAEADSYLKRVLERWRLPLADVLDERLEPEPESYFPGMPYWIDAMLEHAVMHPIRHEFQLKELIQRQSD